MHQENRLTEKLVRNCAATLANLKTGSLFSYSCSDECDVCAEIRELNHLLVKKGLRLIPVTKRKKCVLIYLYRVKSLSNDFLNTQTQELLKRLGYSFSRPELCIKHLIEKMKTDQEFPHEIGLFLGYPPGDVEGFIRHGAQNCLLCGKWKVYQEPEKAAELLRSFKKCESCYIRNYNKGWDLERLVVAS